MRVAVGGDHRALEAKKLAVAAVEEAGHACRDFGTLTEESVDYPDIAEAVGKAVGCGACERGILICDTGIGMSIAANKVRGVKAALCHDEFTAVRARAHNDANILCISGRTDPETMKRIIAAFLMTGFEGGRHARRVDKITALEG